MQNVIVARHGFCDERNGEYSLTKMGVDRIIKLGELILPYVGENVSIHASNAVRVYESAGPLSRIVNLQGEIQYTPLLFVDRKHNFVPNERLEQINELVSSLESSVDTAIFVTHLPIALLFPNYFIEKRGWNKPTRWESVNEAEAVLLDFDSKSYKAIKNSDDRWMAPYISRRLQEKH